VKASLGTEAPYILDGGPCTLGIESTIIGFESGRPVLYRWGAISREEIKAIAGPVSLYELESDDIRSPGQLQKHYSPHTPLELCTDIPARLAQLSDQRVGLILWTTKSSIPHQPQIVLSPKGDINEAAHHLFAALHQMDQSKLDIILAETVPPKGVGRAINDRLRKAAAR
jgi:L-threonylcarbamoyladenylate synthase